MLGTSRWRTQFLPGPGMSKTNLQILPMQSGVGVAGVWLALWIDQEVQSRHPPIQGQDDCTMDESNQMFPASERGATCRTASCPCMRTADGAQATSISLNKGAFIICIA